VRVDEHTIELAGSPVFYRSAPAADRSTPPADRDAPATPPLPLYLHGIPMSSDDWTESLERTGGLAPDLPGFGRTGKGGQLDLSLEGHADFIAALLTALEIERVQLVMHDWGAAGGLLFAQRQPQRVERIVLCNALPLTGGFRWHGLPRIWRQPILGELAMGSVNRRLLARWLRRGSANDQTWPDTRVQAVWEQFDQGTQRAILRLHRDADQETLLAAGVGLAALKMPVLVLWGELDPWFPSSFGDAYAGALPNAAPETIADAGHWPWLDRPELVQRIAGFLETGR
jgi:pimeloyl-ACP methyl ester carboxylesterase